MKIEQEILASKNFAVIGVSRDRRKFGYAIFNELKKRNMNVIPINPSAESIDDVKCYKSLTDYNGDIDSVITVVKPQQTLNTLKEGISLGIKKFWLQQGSASKEAIEFCKQNNLTFVSGKCVLMYLEPVTSIHKFHRFFAKLFGKY